MLPDSTDQEILLFGGKDYVPLFCKLTQNVKGKRKVFHSSGQGPSAPGCMLVKFENYQDELALRVCQHLH
jgi:hypothetical protein